ncbi:gamma-glutamylcyclotransferase family protein [Flavobacteriaceae bacterium S356]|uniref:Gamma-glutamylcyclotransferase family protein n=1 Tax=Asprobacillus argus TaxID=3076534 RepID=A0ABU3LD75_9FLAO|nr:gamma-glutamylcyclotransferase family protein [Flavobacteriaceae bacterium S356]
MNVFFYGLFMDTAILARSGIYPSSLQKGYLQDYALKIGNRASLIPSTNERSYGVVITADQESLAKLYAAPSVADYIPEEVMVHVASGGVIKALCYNLPEASLSGTNPVYAASLYKLAKKLGFPESYLEKIKKNIE